MKSTFLLQTVLLISGRLKLSQTRHCPLSSFELTLELTFETDLSLLGFLFLGGLGLELELELPELLLDVLLDELDLGLFDCALCCPLTHIPALIVKRSQLKNVSQNDLFKLYLDNLRWQTSLTSWHKGLQGGNSMS